MRAVRLDPIFAMLVLAVFCYIAGTLRGYLMAMAERRRSAPKPFVDIGPLSRPLRIDSGEDEQGLWFRERRPFDWGKDLKPSDPVFRNG